MTIQSLFSLRLENQFFIERQIKTGLDCMRPFQATCYFSNKRCANPAAGRVPALRSLKSPRYLKSTNKSNVVLIEITKNWKEVNTYARAPERLASRQSLADPMRLMIPSRPAIQSFGAKEKRSCTHQNDSQSRRKKKLSCRTNMCSMS